MKLTGKYQNIYKVLLCLALLFLLDRTVGWGLRYLYFKPKEGKYHDLTYALDSTRADLVIVGSSRATHSYVAQQIQDSLHISCYNAGMWGTRFLHQYATLQTIVHRYHPKIIIWDYWEGLVKNELTYQDVASLDPFYNTHEEIRKVIDFAKPSEKYKMLSRVYPYNSTLMYNLNKVVNAYKSDKKEASVKGFVPLKHTWTEPLTVSSYNGATMPIDSNCVRFYKAAIAFCKKENIKLIMIESPYYGKYLQRPNYDVLAEQIAHEQDIPFLDMTNKGTLLTAGNFSEPKHLNENGAHLFTAEVIKAIRKHTDEIIKQ
ncbi:hypothetical protein DYU05_05225 [Mucilaginibacter terrenus]|uniref:SGNH/GDSL hydrolase family protein n=1 Tax=Mucilaginibacter terrenus TaxID=2482727 RepID=A0A3E2NVM4_9SPHI|nr:hypothetical protein [Mucilaginibacter terrenus]RFZ85007.1 hypothetical protein DYU05_05225 [Mucilaginibacter terrenus]